MKRDVQHSGKSAPHSCGRFTYLYQENRLLTLSSQVRMESRYGTKLFFLPLPFSAKAVITLPRVSRERLMLTPSCEYIKMLVISIVACHCILGHSLCHKQLLYSVCSFGICCITGC